MYKVSRDRDEYTRKDLRKYHDYICSSVNVYMYVVRNVFVLASSR